MFVKNLSISGDKLEGEFGGIKPEEVKRWWSCISPEYVLRNVIKFYLIVETSYAYIKVSARFVKNHDDDEMNYTLQISSRKLELNVTLLKCQEQQRIIYEQQALSDCFNFDLKVVLNTVSCAAPFGSLYEDTDLVDFELKGENESVRIHKLALASTSPFFKRMLSGEWKETEGIVDVPETSLKTLQDLKDYIYLGTIPSTGVEKLLMISMRYMMNGLEQKCVNKIIDGMTAKNAYELIQFSMKHNAIKLRVAILENLRYGVVDIHEIEETFRQSSGKITVTQES